jgi:deoxyinosine 3'endonuclease (endonuclease V)
MQSVELYDVTLTLDTSIYAAADVLSDSAVVSNAVPYPGGRAILRSVVLLDEDDQAAALDLYFIDSNVAMGTKNAAISITDANARKLLGKVAIATTDYADLIASRLATKSELALVLKAVAGSPDIYVAAVNGAGTPTYTAAGIKLRLGIQWEGS